MQVDLQDIMDFKLNGLKTEIKFPLEVESPSQVSINLCLF